MDEPMKLYTIYFNTSDLPGKYSVREFEIRQAEIGRQGVRVGRLVGTANDLYGARSLVPRGMIFTPRATKDDRVIVETWI